MKKLKATKRPAPKPAPKPKRVEVDKQPQMGPTVYSKIVSHEEAARLRDGYGFCVIKVSGDRVTVAADAESYHASRGSK
jgi:hypothetical protein